MSKRVQTLRGGLLCVLLVLGATPSRGQTPEPPPEAEAAPEESEVLLSDLLRDLEADQDQIDDYQRTVERLSSLQDLEKSTSELETEVATRKADATRLPPSELSVNRVRVGIRRWEDLTEQPRER